MSDIRTRILGKKLRTAPIEREDWEDVYVREVPANRRQEIADLAEAKDGLERTVMLACVYEDGSAVFTEEHIPELGELPLADLNFVANAFFDLNGWTEKGRADAGKDSGVTPIATSRSRSAAR